MSECIDLTPMTRNFCNEIMLNMFWKEIMVCLSTSIDVNLSRFCITVLRPRKSYIILIYNICSLDWSLLDTELWDLDSWTMMITIAWHSSHTRQECSILVTTQIFQLVGQHPTFTWWGRIRNKVNCVCVWHGGLVWRGMRDFFLSLFRCIITSL